MKNSVYTWKVATWKDSVGIWKDSAGITSHVVVAQSIDNALLLMTATGISPRDIISIERDVLVRSVQAEAVTDDPASLIQVVMRDTERAS